MGSALLRPGTLADGTTLRYALGIETDPVGGLPAWSHAGSTGSYRAWLGYIPDQKLSVALVCNSGAVNTEDLGPEVAARFLPGPMKAERSSTSPALVPEGVAGIYRNALSDAVVTAKVAAAGLHLNDGPGFSQTGADRLATADGRRAATPIRDRTGAVTGLIVTRIGNAPIKLMRKRPWALPAADLPRSPVRTGVTKSTACNGSRPAQTASYGVTC